MADGFKIAEAFVDIKAKMDGRAIKRTIEQGLREAGLREAGTAAGKEIGDGIDEAIGNKAKESADKIKKEFTDSGKDSKNGFSTNFRGILGVIGEVGSQGAKIFADLFNFRNPMTAIAVLGTALLTLPVIASAITVSMVAIFGAAFASIGILAAAQNDGVKLSFIQAWNEIKAIAQGISEPFEGSLKHVADVWVSTFGAFAPELEKSFSSMAPHIDGFIDGIGLSLRELIPAIGPVTDAFNLLLDKLAQRLPDLFRSLSNSVIDLSAALERNPGAVDAVINTFIFLIDTVTNVTVAFTDFAGWVQRNSDLVRTLFNSLTALINPLAGLIFNFTGLGEAASPVEAAIAATDRAILIAQTTMGTASTAAKDYALSIDEITKKNLSAEQASLRFDQAVLKMTTSIGENGKSLDSTTDAGAKNKDALLSMADAANRAKDKFIEQGHSADSVRNKSIAMREEMIRQARQLGLTEDGARKLIESYFAIPEKEETRVSAPGAVQSKREADDVKKSAENIPQQTMTVINVLDNASPILGGITGMIGAIARQVWVNVTAIFSEDGNIVNFANGAERHIAQIAGAGSMRVWAEPETGGEAYIPLAPNKRPRSEQILNDVASRFGLTLARPMANGGILDSAVIRNGSGGNRGGSITISNLNVSVSLTGVWDFTDPSQARVIADRIAPAIREAIRVDERRYK